MASKKVKESIAILIGRWVVRVFLLSWVVTILFPMIWTIYTSFKTNKEFFANVWALPEKLMVENYEYAWNSAQFSKYFLNSLFVVAVAVTLLILFSSATSYVVAKYRGAKILHRFYLLVMAVPGVLVLVPQYFMFMKNGWTDNLLVIAMLTAIQGIPTNVIMQSAFMRTVDNALFEAADIDGATEFQKFFNIMVPCARSCLFLTALTGILGAWNDYIMPLTYIETESKYTVAVGLSYLQNSSTYGVEYGGLFAGLVIAMIPIIIVYLIFQRPLQEGLRTDGGVKG